MTNEEMISKILVDFATAMYEWESKHAPRIQKEFNERSGLATARMNEAQSELRDVFRKFCLATEHPQREGSAGDPPDYHPDFFDILEIAVKGKKAEASVRQPRLGRMVPSKGGGIVTANTGKEFITYHLRLTDNGWRLDDRRESHYDDGTIIKMGL